MPLKFSVLFSLHPKILMLIYENVFSPKNIKYAKFSVLELLHFLSIFEIAYCFFPGVSLCWGFSLKIRSHKCWSLWNKTTKIMDLSKKIISTMALIYLWKFQNVKKTFLNWSECSHVDKICKIACIVALIFIFLPAIGCLKSVENLL